MEYRKYVTVKDLLYKKFMSDKVFLGSREYNVNQNGKDYTIVVEKYKDFKVLDVAGKIKIFRLPQREDFIIWSDWVDVTDNPLYTVKNILNGSLSFSNSFLEGTDGTGKTTVTNALAEEGIITEDRCYDAITKHVMDEEAKQDARVASVENFLKNNPEKNVVFLYLSDRKEHHRRIFGRGRKPTKADLRAFAKQDRYLDIYDKLKHYNNLFLVDVVGKTPEQMKEIVKTIVLKKENVNQIKNSLQSKQDRVL